MNFQVKSFLFVNNVSVQTAYYARGQVFAAQADFAQAFSVSAVSAGPVIRKYFPETWLWYMQRPE